MTKKNKRIKSFFPPRLLTLICTNLFDFLLFTSHNFKDRKASIAVNVRGRSLQHIPVLVNGPSLAVLTSSSSDSLVSLSKAQNTIL